MKRLIRILAAFVGFLVPALVVLAPPPTGAASGADAPPLVQSPPVFALRGSPAPVTAVTSGLPRAVTLVVNGVAASRMHQGPAGAWHGTISPVPLAGVSYRVDAAYRSGHIVRGDTQELTYLDRIVEPPVVSRAADGVRVLSLRLGRDVGVAEGSQAARILPASFDVDEARGTTDVLDSPNARVATFDETGRTVSSVPIGTATAADIVRTADGTTYIADAVHRSVTRIDRSGVTVTPDDALAAEPANVRLLAHGSDVFLREPSQGRLVPLLPSTATPPSDRVVPDGSSVLIGDGSSNALRVRFDRTVLDVAEYIVDGRSTLWALVDLDDATMRLLSVDASDAVSVRSIDASVFGDVTRRLAPLGDGVVVMSSSRTDLFFTRYAR